MNYDSESDEIIEPDRRVYNIKPLSDDERLTVELPSNQDIQEAIERGRKALAEIERAPRPVVRVEGTFH